MRSALVAVLRNSRGRRVSMRRSPRMFDSLTIDKHRSQSPCPSPYLSPHRFACGERKRLAFLLNLARYPSPASFGWNLCHKALSPIVAMKALWANSSSSVTSGSRTVTRVRFTSEDIAALAAAVSSTRLA
jgi:hypothetical protein